MSDANEEPDYAQITQHVIGRIAFGAMAACAIAAIFREIELDESLLSIPLALAPLLAMATLLVLPGRRAVIGAAVLFLIGRVIAEPSIYRDKGSAIAVFCLIFALVLGQGGWWHILRRQPTRGLRSYDAPLFLGGLVVGYLIEMTFAWWALLPAVATAGFALWVDGSLWLTSSVEKSFQHLSGAIRVLGQDGWMRRTFGFVIVFALSLHALIRELIAHRIDLNGDFYGGIALLCLGLTMVPALWRMADRLDSRWLIGGSLAVLLLLNLPVWLAPTIWRNSLPIEFESSAVLIAALLLPLSWRRLINEIATPLPQPMRYLAEPLLLTTIGLAALLLYPAADSLVGTLETEIGSYNPPTLIWTLALATIAAFALGLPSVTRRQPDSDFKDVLFFPGQNPLVQLPRGADACVVTIAYWIPEENQPAFEKILPAVGKVRRRAGALGWQVTQDPVEPIIWREHFTVDSWAEYADAIKLETPRDRELKQELFNLNDWESLPAEDHYPIRAT